MTAEQIRLACIDLAIDTRIAPGEDPRDRAAAFQDLVGTDELILACLRMAVKSHGALLKDPGMRTRAILDQANTYLSIVRPEPKPILAPPATKKKGGRYTTSSR